VGSAPSQRALGLAGRSRGAPPAADQAVRRSGAVPPGLATPHRARSSCPDQQQSSPSQQSSQQQAGSATMTPPFIEDRR